MVSASFEPFFPQQAKRLVQMTSPSIQVFQLSILREAAVAVTLHCSEEHYFALLIRTPMVGSCSPGVPRGGGLSGPRRRDRDGVSHRAMVSENDQELTQKDDTARWLLTSLPSSSCSGN